MVIFNFKTSEQDILDLRLVSQGRYHQLQNVKVIIFTKNPIRNKEQANKKQAMMDMKRIVLVVISIVIIGAAAYLFLTAYNQEDTHKEVSFAHRLRDLKITVLRL